MVARWLAGPPALPHQPGDASRSWTWRVIIEHLPMIRAAGYTAILLSPHESACGGKQSLGYDPYDFRSFGSAHGTEMELAELIRKAHALRIQVSRSNTSAGRASGARGPGGP